MRIVHVWDADYPWDVRVEKVSQALLEAGHDVHIVARNRKRSARYERVDGLHVHRLPSLPPAVGRLNEPFTFPAFFSPVWLREIRRVARAVQADVVLARDLPIAPAAARVARSLGRPCVFDMAECYPEMLKAIWRHERVRLRNIVVRNPWLAYAVEAWTVRNVDHVLVTVEESRTRLLRYGIPPERISIVSNTPDLRRFPPVVHAPPADPRRLCLTYVGGLGPFRGLDIVLRAAAAYRHHNAGLIVRLIGAGRGEAELRRLVADLAIGDVVVFEGFVEHARVPKLIAEADVCIVPHRSDSHSNTTVPNKLFDYMAAAKPVVASDVTPIRRILQDAQCGLVYPDGDVTQLVTRLRELENPSLRATLGNNGRGAVEREYNWDRDRRVLVAAVEAVGHPVGR